MTTNTPTQPKQVVSPFEYAIMQSVDPERAQKCRAETAEEKADRIRKDFENTASKIKIKKSE